MVGNWKSAGFFYWRFGMSEISKYTTSLDVVQPDKHLEVSSERRVDLDARDKEDYAYNQETVKVLLRKKLEGIAGRLKDCGDTFYKRTCRNDGLIVGSVKSHCGQDRLCPTCARIRRNELLEEVLEHIKIISSRPVSKYNWRILTLPVKTDGQYRRAAGVALRGFSKLWRGILKGGQGNPTAAFIHLENAPGTGNVHLHCLYYGPYIRQAVLSDRWAKLTGSFVVDIRAVKGRSIADLRAAAREVIKYCTKFTAVNNGRLVELWEANKGRRLMMRYGLFRKNCLEAWSGQEIKVTSKEKEDPICPLCGCREYDYILVNDQGGRAPPFERLAGSVEM